MPCRFRDIATAVGQNSLDVFPLRPRQRLRRVIGLFLAIGFFVRSKSRQDLIGVSRFRDVVGRSQFQGFDSIGDTPVTGEQDDVGFRTDLLDHLEQFQSVLTGHFQINDGAAGWALLDGGHRFFEP